ncbi:PQ loop repeat-domain-containing protein [Glomus cerebriforme]|uniref:PQ loop repeat-domain-containing protein n=1 Tax=Glomus cerebriforme TaxID=658196 RepID=A0A397T0H5_9GLOM|nr:PQ loop repeat-domain-containing protein [Glomus cerebriforme]
MSGGCDSISNEGIAYIEWIHTILGSCVYGNKGLISYILGYVTIACWLNAQLPQLITNYKNKSVDGLSLPFLVSWLLGDISSFFGGILTDQLPFQIYLAAYFCVVDFILFFQYFYYTWIRNPSKSESNEEIPVRPLSTQSFKDSILEGAKKSYTFPTRKNQSHQRISSMVFAILLFTFHSTSSISSSFSTSPTLLSGTHDEMSLGGYSKFFGQDEFVSLFIGRVFAWISTILYLTSRMPQIWKNYTRKSVEGLSMFMFIFAALANLSYATSILINPKLETEPNYLLKEVPYLLGSVGTCTFDVIILIQWYIFRDPEHRHRKRRNRHSRSTSYGDRIGYHQLSTDDETYRSGRRNGQRSGQIDGGNFV